MEGLLKITTIWFLFDVPSSLLPALSVCLCLYPLLSLFLPDCFSFARLLFLTSVFFCLFISLCLPPLFCSLSPYLNSQILFPFIFYFLYLNLFHPYSVTIHSLGHLCSQLVWTLTLIRTRHHYQMSGRSPSSILACRGRRLMWLIRPDKDCSRKSSPFKFYLSGSSRLVVLRQIG